ncbi:hypothetical protein ACFL6I_03235 [candidate division KSB1 bacterium]
MNTIHIVLLAFGFGLLLGCFLAYIVMRRSLRQSMKSFSEVVGVMSSQRAEKEQEYQARKDNLLLLAHKLKQIESNIQKLRRKEYNEYIADLNELFNSIGISEIE